MFLKSSINKSKNTKMFSSVVLRIRIRNPGSGIRCFFDPKDLGSVIRNNFFSGSWIRILDPIA
jgi:hypothetical protein